MVLETTIVQVAVRGVVVLVVKEQHPREAATLPFVANDDATAIA